MYHRIVASKVRGTFAGLSEQRPEALLDQLATPFTYRFVGDTTLGGIRTTRADMEAWFARVARLLPGLRFHPVTVAVHGPPWNTMILTHVEVEADGYHNEFFQSARLRWGRLTDIVTLEDLDLLRGHLDQLAASGVDEATAPQILSED
ncbi:MAG: nuclear transport factor 2 family protein [Acidimicrobiales bacterium]